MWTRVKGTPSQKSAFFSGQIAALSFVELHLVILEQ